MTDPIIGTNQCNHGNLRRSCEVCDLQARLAECKRERDEAQEYISVCDDSFIEVCNERDTLRAQLTETQRLLEVQGDKLTAEVAKLNERYDALARVSVVGVEWKMKAEKLEAELAALREACSSALDTLTTGEINVKGRVAAVLRDAALHVDFASR